jgi:hypothetical protein
MNETLMLPRVGRPARLIELLVGLRRARRPLASESEVWRGVWSDLRDLAGLDDPNHLSRADVEAAAWALLGLLTAESRERGPYG